MERAKVLIVDDEPTIRNLVANIIRRQGHEPVEANNGLAALEALAQEGPVDLLITDLQMPEMDGLELVRRLRKDKPDLPVLCISGCCPNINELLGSLDSNTGFVEKPFNMSKLKSSVERLLVV